MINQELIESLFLQLSSQFHKAFDGSGEDEFVAAFATVIKSNTRTVDFSWLGESPQMRKWIGQRVINQLKNFRYEAGYEEYELTMGVKRMEILDNTLSHYSLQSFAGGQEARFLRPKLVAKALTDGETGLCYDGQPFFSASHPVGEDGDVSTVSNLKNNGGAWAATPFYMADLSKVIKPIILIDRLLPEFQSFTSMNDMHVFMNREFLFGTNSAHGTAYGLWQTCFRDEAAATVNSLLALELAMKSLTKDKKDEDGRRPFLGIRPTHIFHGLATGERLRALINSPHLTDFAGDPLAPGATDTGKANPVYKRFQLVEVSWLP